VVGPGRLLVLSWVRVGMGNCVGRRDPSAGGGGNLIKGRFAE